MRLLTCLLFAIGLAGCASVPTELETSNEDALVAYKQAKAQQDKVVGQPAAGVELLLTFAIRKIKRYLR